ncbi:hypothetical protein AB0M44_43930, partial [Streptosporangium subroseum]|uniref:hypothetical protein n=1 Tax=Streptosporangium subroseum TaxID=106412 RepID=UPI0034268529
MRALPRPENRRPKVNGRDPTTEDRRPGTDGRDRPPGTDGRDRRPGIDRRHPWAGASAHIWYPSYGYHSRSGLLVGYYNSDENAELYG